MIYLYGLTDPAAPPPAITEPGVAGAVQICPLPQGHLVYAPHDAALTAAPTAALTAAPTAAQTGAPTAAPTGAATGAPIRPKRRNLLAHTRLLEELARQTTVLPMRFGLLADDLPSVIRLVDGQAEAIAAQMQRLAGQVEFGLRLAFPEEAALNHQLGRHPALAAERDRLRRRGPGGHFEQAEFGRRLGEALDRHRTDAQRRLVAQLRPLVTDLILRSPETAYQVLHATLLLPRGTEDAITAQLTALAQALDFAPGAEPLIQLVGPAPLYNFVRLNLAHRAEAA